jgi:pilus assembly protein Flp/PilA
MLELYVAVQNWFAGLRDEERGAAAVEYGLMIGLIAAVIVVTVGFLGVRVDAIFDEVLKAIGG